MAIAKTATTAVPQQLDAPTKGVLINPALDAVTLTLTLDQLKELHEALESHRSSWRVKVDRKSAAKQLASRNKGRVAKDLAPVEQKAMVAKVILDGGKARYHGPRTANNLVGDNTYTTQQLVDKFVVIQGLFKAVGAVIQEQA